DPSSNTITINVTPVNDAPFGMDRSVGVVVSSTVIISDFGFSDPLDHSPPSSVPANNLKTVTILSIPSVGTLTKNGVAIGATPATISVAIDILRYVVPATVPGTQPSFIFQVQDDGGTANGGQDTDQTPNSINITFAGPNPQPVGIDSTINARV